MGLELESQVAAILEKMIEEEKILAFICHAHYSAADRQGKDFSVDKKVGGEKVTCSFGVTISYKSWTEAKARHRGVPQFCFPIGAKPGTIERRIIGLFRPIVEKKAT